MAYELRDMSGSLFPNKKKETEKHPNLTGTAMIEGVEYYVSGWTKESNSGKWISLAFKAKDGHKSEAKPKDLENDIPF